MPRGRTRPQPRAPRADPTRRGGAPAARVEHRSFWLATTSSPARPPLQGRTTADVVVVGAGMVGLTTALLLARSGAEVVVLEAASVGAGVTGSTTGKLTALQGFIYADLVRRHGPGRATAFAEGNQAALSWIRRTVLEEGVRCDWRDRSAISAVTAEMAAGRVEEEYHAAVRAGLPVELIDNTSAPVPIALGVRLADQAEFHARRYLLGLAELAGAAGVRIYENTRVEGLDRASGRVSARTPDGEAQADRVVLATHVPSPDTGLLSARYTVSRSWVAGLELPAGRLHEMLYLETRDGVRSLRTQPLEGGRELLLLAGAAHRTGEGPGADPAEPLARQARAWFPDAEHRWSWSAQDPKSTDLLPMVGAALPGSDRVLVATAFRKWGLTTGTMAAHLLSARVEGRPHPWDDLAAPWHASRLLRVHAALRAASHNLHAARHLLTGRLAGGRPVTQVPPGQASVSGPPWQRVASYRDGRGRLHRLSATCTHLGCEVRWNAADRSWDCPCHGSRFDPVDGHVLDGPADRSLPAA